MAKARWVALAGARAGSRPLPPFQQGGPEVGRVAVLGERFRRPLNRFERPGVVAGTTDDGQHLRHAPRIAVVRFWLAYSGTPEKFADQIPAKMKGGYAALDAMERHLLEGKSFLVGGRYGIADISLFAYTHVAREGDFDLTPYTAINAWLERVAAQPGHVAIDA